MPEMASTAAAASLMAMILPMFENEMLNLGFLQGQDTKDDCMRTLYLAIYTIPRSENAPSTGRQGMMPWRNSLTWSMRFDRFALSVSWPKRLGRENREVTNRANDLNKVSPCV